MNFVRNSSNTNHYTNKRTLQFQEFANKKRKIRDLPNLRLPIPNFRFRFRPKWQNFLFSTKLCHLLIQFGARNVQLLVQPHIEGSLIT